MKTGLELFLAKEHKKYRGSRLGVLCHQASVTSDFVHISDWFAQKKNLGNVTCYFGPQHGIRGEKQDNMVESDDFIDPRAGVPVFSLYGVTREPTEQMFSHLDVLLIDLQDIGGRIYTFMYTMANCMRAAKQMGKRIVVLDRPNPIGGLAVEGNLLETGFTSFVGQYPMCTRHGMTMGELALMFNEAYGIGCDLDVVRMQGWKRSDYSDKFSNDWVCPSPNIPNLASCILFPGMVHFEGTNVSEGRGTTRPFEYIGAPFIDADQLAGEMNRLKQPGVHYRPIYFQPTYQKQKDQVCGGVNPHITDRKKFNSFRAGIHLLAKIAALYPRSFQWKQPPYEYEHERMPIDLIAGTDELRKTIDAGKSLKDFEERSKQDVKKFLRLRKDFLLYRAN